LRAKFKCRNCDAISFLEKEQIEKIDGDFRVILDTGEILNIPYTHGHECDNGETGVTDLIAIKFQKGGK
jgi:hypothetical protein